MGYDADIVAFKKKALKNVQRIMPNHSFQYLYSNYLFMRMYPNEYNFPEDEQAKWICSPSIDIFNDFLKIKLKNEEARIINKDIYLQFYKYLESKLKSITLFDCANDKKYDELYVNAIIETYKSMRDKPIDFETEFVVFQHDW